MRSRRALGGTTTTHTKGRTSVKGTSRVAGMADVSMKDRSRLIMLAAIAVAWGSMLLWIASDAQASAGEAPLDVQHTPAEIHDAEESATSLTNFRAAEELPHRDLNRGESEELLQAV